MSELLIAILVNTLLGIVLLALFYWKRAADDERLGNADEAMAVFRREFPDAAGTAFLAADRRSALIDIQRDSGVGLLQRRGLRWNCRIVAPGELASVRLEQDGALELRFADFGWPRARVRIADAGARSLWHGRLTALRTQVAPPRRADPRRA